MQSVPVSKPDPALEASLPDAPRLYVNHIQLSVTLSEMCIDLGQCFAGNPVPAAGARLVTSPVHLQRFEVQIASALRDYRAEFGAIPGITDAELRRETVERDTVEIVHGTA
jgi:hypothetical protein